jgi:hypothetical protein
MAIIARDKDQKHFQRKALPDVCKILQRSGRRANTSQGMVPKFCRINAFSSRFQSRAFVQPLMQRDSPAAMLELLS